MGITCPACDEPLAYCACAVNASPMTEAQLIAGELYTASLELQSAQARLEKAYAYIRKAAQ